jgi:hypothetical protein
MISRVGIRHRLAYTIQTFIEFVGLVKASLSKQTMVFVAAPLLRQPTLQLANIRTCPGHAKVQAKQDPYT